MKKITGTIISLFLFIVFFSFSGKTTAQTLYFCEGVDDDGNPKNASSTFTISSSGGYLDILVNLGYDINTYMAKYVIYTVDSYGNEKYSTTINQDTKPTWTWFWKEVTFYAEGKYNIYVYDGNDRFLTSGTLRINFQ